MTATEVLAALRSHGVHISVHEGELRLVGVAVLPDALYDEIETQRHELVAAQLVADGRGLLAGLRDRGVTVRLADGESPLAGPAELIDGTDRDLLTAQRDAVLAALRAEASASPPERSEVPGEPSPVPTSPTVCPQCHHQDYLPLGGGWRRCWMCGWRWGPADTQDPGDPSDLNQTATLLGITSVPRLVVLPRPGEGLASSSPEAASDEAAEDYPRGVLCVRDSCRGLGWNRDAESGGWRCRRCGGPLAVAMESGAIIPRACNEDVAATPTSPEPLGVLCRAQGCGSLRWRWDAVMGDWRCRKCGGPLPPWLLKVGA